MAKVAGKLLKKKLGFRMLMDLIPLDATLVKGMEREGSHESEERLMSRLIGGLLAQERQDVENDKEHPGQPLEPTFQG